MKFTLSFLLFLTSITLAQSKCLTADDLDKGIIIESQGRDGLVQESVRRLHANNYITTIWIKKYGPALKFVSLKKFGFFMLFNGTAEHPSSSMQTYSSLPKTFPPGLNKKLKYQSSIVRKPGAIRIDHVLESVKKSTLDFKGCPYEVYMIHIDKTSDTRKNTVMKLADHGNYSYIPELKYSHFGDFNSLNSLSFRLANESDFLPGGATYR